MNVLLSLLHSSPEYESLRAMLDAGQTAAVSGVSQIARAHWIAALHEDTGRPVVAVCQDEMAASISASRVTVSRTLNDFARRGWVELGYREVRLLRPEELRALCQS